MNILDFYSVGYEGDVLKLFSTTLICSSSDCVHCIVKVYINSSSFLEMVAFSRGVPYWYRYVLKRIFFIHDATVGFHLLKSF